MKYDIFLSDFDGTLVRADKTISERNINAIKRYRAAGGIFAVVTGRGLNSILPRMRELGITEGLVVACQGAVVADIATGKFLMCEGFSYEMGVHAIKAFEEENVHLHLYTPTQFYCNRDDEALKMYEDTCGTKAIVWDKEPLSELARREKLTVIKLLSMVTKEESEKLIARMRAKLGDKYYVTRSSDYLVEALPAGMNKGCAVDFLSQYYKVPTDKIGAIGDGENDLPLLEKAGGKYAVGNAVPLLRRIAKTVPSVEEDGVAVAIEDIMS